jgi:hypothetical protein
LAVSGLGPAALGLTATVAQASTTNAAGATATALVNSPAAQTSSTAAASAVADLPTLLATLQPGPPFGNGGSTVPTETTVVVPPQAPALQPTTLAPAALPLSSAAPVAALDPANFLLAQGLGAALRAGSLPSLLNTQTTETGLGSGGDGGRAGSNAPEAGPGAPIDVLPAAEAPEEVQQLLLELLRFLSSTRPAGQVTDAPAEHVWLAP